GRAGGAVTRPPSSPPAPTDTRPPSAYRYTRRVRSTSTRAGPTRVRGATPRPARGPSGGRGGGWADPPGAAGPGAPGTAANTRTNMSGTTCGASPLPTLRFSSATWPPATSYSLSWRLYCPVSGVTRADSAYEAPIDRPRLTTPAVSVGRGAPATVC